jgi:ubiquinone/menaquinone biosynthesis C-methylase UbiE
MDMMQPRGKVCLSLGCGLGRFLRAYIGGGAKLAIGADLNVDNLLKCKQTGADLVRCDIERLPIRGNSIEAMECVATVEHLPHPKRLVEEIRRTSANKGISFVTWVSFDWSRALTDPEIGERLLMKVRDAIFDLLPAAVTEKMVMLHIPFSSSYGMFRNKGFSLSDVSKTYEGASMHITWSEKFSDENLVAVTAVPAIGRPT